MTRVRLIDRGSGATIDLTSAALAELSLSGVRSEGAAPAVETKLEHYRAETLKVGKTVLLRVDSSVESSIVGLTRDSELAERVAAVLNRVDPGTIAPAPPPLPVKSVF